MVRGKQNWAKYVKILHSQNFEFGFRKKGVFKMPPKNNGAWSTLLSLVKKTNNLGNGGNCEILIHNQSNV